MGILEKNNWKKGKSNMMKFSHKLAKDKKLASYILLGLATFILILIFILFLRYFGGLSKKLQPKEKMFLEKGSTESYDKKLFQQ